MLFQDGRVVGILIPIISCEFKLCALSRTILSLSNGADTRAKAATPGKSAETEKTEEIDAWKRSL